MPLKKQAYILPVIVLAQFLCTSLWFAGNAVIPGIIDALALKNDITGIITSAVQLGFIFGTLIFALFTISDRYSPSRVFMLSAFSGAFFNLFIILFPSYPALLVSRILVGFSLAGIYPVGMKIASDYHEKGLGKALGFLVGALVLGTAFPHVLKSFSEKAFSWQFVIYGTSIIAALGGLLIGLLIPDGPFRTKAKNAINLKASVSIFKVKKFRRAALGYFGHMWELYTLWAFLPLILLSYKHHNEDDIGNLSFLAFLVIASGFLSSVVGGYISTKFGSAKVAFYSQLISFLCCLGAPFLLLMPFGIFLVYLFIWSTSVIADSPQYSTLVAQFAPAENKGTALTIVNSLGFTITIISIQLLTLMIDQQNKMDILTYYLPLLALGPVFGLWSMRTFIFKAS